MAKINLLSSKIYNRIAAGEVIERPFSVVKELVENSIDAGATNISIDIERGGISSIVISDNGIGIEKSELKKALLPHATSKISSLKDLDNILSLGFRGEALASIASVSKLTIISKPKKQELGAQISSHGGEISPIVDCGASDGTVIKVNNLFFNTPVREKFLHSERSEENEISLIVARFILGNPNISFKYTANGKLIYNSYGDGFESAMACVYGVETIDNCFYINAEKNGIKLTGYIGKHHFTKGNRTYQTTFVNGRFVQNQTLSSAIANAYSSYLMKRQYPFYVISISIPPEIVDVNVHPNKLDIRFANNQIVYGTVYSIISKVLDGTSEAISIITDKTQNNNILTTKSNNDYATHRANFPNSNNTGKSKLGEVYFKDIATESLPFKQDVLTNETKNNGLDIFEENKLFLENLEKQKKEQEEKIQQIVPIEKNFRYIGQALNTYLIFEDGENVYFADQHAAHERILFDKLNESLKNSNIIKQPLLVPYVLNVNNEEFEFLSNKIESLYKIGIEISEFGRNAFKVSAIPSFLIDMNLQKFFNDILGDLNSLKSLTANNLLLEKLAQKACKSAIKSGDILSDMDVSALLEKLKQNIGLKCPHGRPVVAKITRTEIDKWFKRII